jgi:DNA polymerase-3 subunit gamma/tau
MNLTTIYRIKTFNDVIAQTDLVSFLKNTLFKKKLFPVYLFSGMRGTGKTSLARIFAAARLCEKYHSFNSNPQLIVPCHNCQSCRLAFSFQHPDLIELDAASHSGVETIRSLIENASLLPSHSDCKFYIIDEAHMLSKSAFNAALKIMEEPPLHVHFILATTEYHKIISTIRSRSILLNFDSIDYNAMHERLKTICNKESIDIDENALFEIVFFSEGSMRDALNAIDTLTMMYKTINKENVLKYFGLSDETLINGYIKSCMQCDDELFIETKKLFSEYRKDKKIFWNKLLVYVQKMHYEYLKTKENTMQINIIALLDLLYHYEEYFLQSNNPEGILDIIFSHIKYKYTIAEEVKNKNNKTTEHDTKENYKENKQYSNIQNNFSLHSSIHITENTSHSISLFIEKIMTHDKALGTIFRQGNLQFDETGKKIISHFKSAFIFYKDFVIEKSSLWKPILEECCGQGVVLDIRFNTHSQGENTLDPKDSIYSPGVTKPAIIDTADIIVAENKPSINSYQKQSYQQTGYNKYNDDKVIVKKNEVGSLTQTIMELFPGTTYKKK